MRIGIDARLWDQTGVGRYIKNLILNLQVIDNKNEYFLFVRNEDFENIKLKLSNPNWKLIKTNLKWHSLKEQIEFPKVLNKENLDLVHFPYFSVPVFYNKTFVVTIHDLIIDHYPTGKASTLFPLLYYLKLFFYKYVILTAARKARKIITPSVATRNEVIDHLKVDKNKIAVTLEAADENLATYSPLNNIPEKYFLYVGNAYPHKNLEFLVEAFNVIKNDMSDANLILVGQSDYFYKRLKEKVTKLHLEDRIIFVGKITDPELSYLYKNTLGLIAPSLMEGFGLPVLEAMNNKCLVICSDITSFREVAKENAIYFNPKNKLEIQNAMLKAYFQKYDKTILDKAYILSKDFSWEKMAKETLKIYESSISLR